MHVGDRGRDLAQVRHPARQPVDILHGEFHAALLRRRQQVQHGVGGAAHSDVERHRVLERDQACDAARQGGGVVLLVVPPRQVDDRPPRLDEQLAAVGVGRDHGAVAGQREAQRLGEAIHRIGSEHPRARATGRAGGAFHHRGVGLRNRGIGGDHHGGDQVHGAGGGAVHDLAGLHRAAGDEHGRNVEAHRRHQHPRRDLVAVGDADQCVGAMRVDHVFHGVGDQLARRQAVQHAVMAHRDSVIDRNGVELLGHTTGLGDLPRDELAEVLQMHMARHELSEGVGNGDDRLAEIAVRHPGGAPERTRARHGAAVRGGAGAISGHAGNLLEHLAT